MAEVSTQDPSPPDLGGDAMRAIEETMLAIGRREIADAMGRIEDVGYDARTVAILQASLLPLTLQITDWTLVRVRAAGTRHVVGFRAGTGLGRWSSPIRSFDPATMSATTASGDRYELIGEPSEDGFDGVLLLWWLARHELSRHEVEIVAVEDL